MLRLRLTLIKSIIAKNPALVLYLLLPQITAQSSEFAYHENISKEHNTEFYFAHLYSSWERGHNENTNGLVRQYLKKGSSYSYVTDDDLASIADQLNNRPRRSLGYASPNKVFANEMSVSQ